MVSADTKLTVFGNDLSQPSRAIWAFCALNGIAHEKKSVDLASGEHKKPEFLAINPSGAVPAIKEEIPGTADFLLNESHAILRYLADSRGVADNWYPKDLRKRANVERYLDSHHTELRACVTGYIARKFFNAEPNITEEGLQKYLDQ